MTRRIALCAAVRALLLTSWILEGAAGPGAAAPLTYTDVAPIFRARCTVCHNAGSVSNPDLSGGLALDSYAGVMRGAAGKKVVAPGKSAESELMLRVQASSPTEMMPKGGPPLSTAEIAKLRAWIDAGAPAGRSTGLSSRAANPDAPPIPADRRLLPVVFQTLVTAPANKIPGGAKPESPLALTATVGPLPPVESLAFTPDGDLLAVGTYRSVTLWNTGSGAPAGVLESLAGPVESLAVSPKGGTLAVAGGAAGAGGEVRFFDLRTRKLSGPTLRGHTDQVLSVAWSPTGDTVATGSQDHTARLWAYPAGQLLQTFQGAGDAVTAVAFSPDGKQLYAASADHNVRRYECATGKLNQLYSGEPDSVTAMALTPDGSRVVASGSNDHLRWWTTSNGDSPRTSDGSGGPVSDIGFSKDGSFLATACADHHVRLWNSNGDGIRTLDGPTDWVYAVAISPDGKRIAAGGADGLVYVWETQSGRLRLELASWPPDRASKPVQWLAATPEGYFDGSPGWVKLVRAQTAGAASALLAALHSPASVLKAWQLAPLDVAKWPAPTMLPSAADGR